MCCVSILRAHNQTYNPLVLSERRCPNKPKEVFFSNPPSTICFLFGLFKRYFLDRDTRTAQLGVCVPGLEGQRLDLLYKMPTEEVARQRMLLNARQLLTLRYYNERTFALPPQPVRVPME